MSEQKKERVIKSTLTGSVWTFEVKGAGKVTFDTRLAHEKNWLRAELFGWKQRISDGAALRKDATPAEKLAEMTRLVQHYESGNESWTLERGEVVRIPIELKALANIQRLEITIVQQRMIAVCEKQRITERQFLAKLAGEKAIQEEILKIRQENAPETTIDVFAEMMAASEPDIDE